MSKWYFYRTSSFILYALLMAIFQCGVSGHDVRIIVGLRIVNDRFELCGRNLGLAVIRV